MTQLGEAIIWGETDRGVQRVHNEDQVYPNSRYPTSVKLPSAQVVQARGHLIAVADGIGGAQVGDTASMFAIKALVDHYYADPRQLPLDKLLESAIKTANTNVYNYVLTSPAFQQAGCTLTAAVIHNDQLIIGHVGDSRAYMIQDDKLYPLTVDHNVAQQRAAGQGPPPQAGAVAGNALTRSLGAGPDVQVDIGRYTLKAGDTVIVCSDGLHSVVSRDVIQQVAAKNTPRNGVRKLIRAANQAGGPDNISVVIGRIPGGAAAAKAGGLLKRLPRWAWLAAMALLVIALLAAALLLVSQRPGSATPGTPVVETGAPGLPAETPTPPTDAPDVVALASEVPPATRVATETPEASPARPSAGEPTRKPTSTMEPTPAPPPTSTPIPTPTPGPPTPSGPAATAPAGSITAPGPVSPPPVLVSPNDGDTPAGSVTLIWSFPQGLSGGTIYQVWLRTEQGGQEKKGATFKSPTESLTLRWEQEPDFFRIAGTEYFWKVAVINATTGERFSDFSAERRFVFRPAGREREPGRTQLPPTEEPTKPPPPEEPTKPPPTEEPTKPLPPTEESTKLLSS